MAIPLFNTSAPLAAIDDEIRAKVAAILDAGVYVLGPEVRAFEAEFASYIGAREAIGVANGTDALVLALRALGVGPGDEVIVPSFTFYASAEAIPHTGARPVFCDIDPETMLLTPDTVRAVMTPRTKAVIAVHLFGNVAPVAEIEALGVPVIEDAAQSAGTRLTDGRRPGALATIATFSFYPSKNLGAFGDGGAITTNDPELAETVRTLRFHGSRDKQHFELVGYNSRLDELQAGILRVQLPHLDAWSDGRRAAARAYADAGLGELVSLPVATPGAEPAWHLYVVRSERADDLLAVLNDAGIGSRSYYRTPAHLQPAMREWGEGLDLPGTDEAARTNLAVPISPVLTRADGDEVVAAARRVAVPSA
jgi:dTDP-3-amino-3,4,6-trideoxy-alpha-D-glucose transaminase